MAHTCNAREYANTKVSNQSAHKNRCAHMRRTNQHEHADGFSQLHDLLLNRRESKTTLKIRTPKNNYRNSAYAVMRQQTDVGMAKSACMIRIQ